MEAGPFGIGAATDEEAAEPSTEFVRIEAVPKTQFREQLAVLQCYSLLQIFDEAQFNQNGMDWDDSFATICLEAFVSGC